MFCRKYQRQKFIVSCLHLFAFILFLSFIYYDGYVTLCTHETAAPFTFFFLAGELLKHVIVYYTVTYVEHSYPHAIDTHTLRGTVTHTTHART